MSLQFHGVLQAQAHSFGFFRRNSFGFPSLIKMTSISMVCSLRSSHDVLICDLCYDACIFLAPRCHNFLCPLFRYAHCKNPWFLSNGNYQRSCMLLAIRYAMRKQLYVMNCPSFWGVIDCNCCSSRPTAFGAIQGVVEVDGSVSLAPLFPFHVIMFYHAHHLPSVLHHQLSTPYIVFLLGLVFFLLLPVNQLVLDQLANKLSCSLLYLGNDAVL